MMTAFMVIMGIASVVLILSVLLQPGNSAGLAGSIGGGAEQLFGKRKSQGYVGILQRICVIAAIIFIVFSVVIVTMQSRM